MSDRRLQRFCCTLLVVLGSIYTLDALRDPEFWGGGTMVFPAAALLGLFGLIGLRPGRRK